MSIHGLPAVIRVALLGVFAVARLRATSPDCRSARLVRRASGAGRSGGTLTWTPGSWPGLHRLEDRGPWRLQDRMQGSIRRPMTGTQATSIVER